jgi:hypothetical protein
LFFGVGSIAASGPFEKDLVPDVLVKCAEWLRQLGLMKGQRFAPNRP